MTLTPRAVIDFETRSACDLKRRGAWLYSKHLSTQILCLAYHLPGWREPRLWHCAHPAIGIAESPAPDSLFEWIASGGLVEAHNAPFEMVMWQHVAVPQHGWPRVAFEQWRCSAAKAAACSLPRSLDGAIDALNLPTKKWTAEGKAFIGKYCKPKKLVKAERELWGDDAIIFNEDIDGLERGWEYCRQDTRGEMCLSESLPDLSPMELRIWQITQRMNMRGVQIDTDLAKAALYLAGRAKTKANAELFNLTRIEAGTQRAKLKAWLADYELLDLPDTKAKTIEWYLEREEMSPRARRVLEIIKEVNRTSTNKYQRMLENVDADDRARELLLYCGAERTGRFSGRGIQIHNLPKGKWAFKGMDMDTACADVKSKDLAWCEAVHGDVMNLLASCLRGSIIAPPMRKLWTADYAAIEARVLLWMAGAEGALKVFREGGDIYCDMASGIYGRVITKATAQAINAMGATERDFGKVAVLGLGYGMGYVKFLITLRTYNIVLTREEVERMLGKKKLAKYEEIVRRKLWPAKDRFVNWEGEFDVKRWKLAEREASITRRRLADDREDPIKVLHELALCKYTVDTYRSRYPEVPALWKAMENSAIQAIQHPGKAIKCGVVTWKVVGRFLKCRLPSGRCLHYCDAHLKTVKTSWGESRPSIRFMGICQKTKKWIRQATYGGKLTENADQAMSRDILCYAKVAVDEHPTYDLAIDVHDEIVAEADDGAGDREEFESLMSDCLTAAFKGCPITAESKTYDRYRK